MSQVERAAKSVATQGALACLLAEELTTKALKPARRVADDKVTYLEANSNTIGGSAGAAKVAESAAKVANAFGEGECKEGAVGGGANGGPELDARCKAAVRQVARAEGSASHGPPTMAVRSGVPRQSV